MRLLIPLLAAAALAAADPAMPTVESAWSRATATGAAAGAVFATLRNPSAADDALLAAECAVAERAELHAHARGDDGVMRMRPVERIAVPAGQAVELRPGGLHIMLLGLRRPLVAGEKLPLTLRFERSGARQVEAAVAVAGAESAPAATRAACCGSR